MYSATKAAVRSFARAWSSYLKGRDIRINAVSPGEILTPSQSKTVLQTADLEAVYTYAAGITPPGRNGEDSEVAKVFAFLASDDSSFVTGSEIFADGWFAQI